MMTLQVILVRSYLHPREITKAKFSNLNNAMSPRGPVAYKIGVELLHQPLYHLYIMSHETEVMSVYHSTLLEAAFTLGISSSLGFRKQLRAR